ncbi:MAG: DUF4389 domain-containing protein [Acidimicrobiales bacterium]
MSDSGLAGSTGTVRVDLDAPLELARWRPLLHWLMAIPLALVGIVWAIGALVYGIVAVFSVLFTKQVSPGVHSFLVRVLRYQFRLQTFIGFMREPYPSFALEGTEDDPGTDPARLSIAPADELKRFGPIYKWILAIPHLIVLYVLGLAAAVCTIVGFFAVLFTRGWPEGLRRFIIGTQRWGTRASAYLVLRDEYPPFSLD